MSGARWLVILLVVVAVVTAGWWFLRRPRPVDPIPGREMEGPVRFDHGEVDVHSPDLVVGVATVRGAAAPGYSSWLVMMDCLETDGCAGRFALEIRYRSDDGRRSVTVTDDFDIAHEGVLRFEGLENQAIALTGIEGLRLEVLSRRTLGDPEPFEIEL